MNPEDEIIRRLKKTSFEEVYAAIQNYVRARGASATDPEKVLIILSEHNWTFDEFVSGVVQQLRSTDWSN